MCHNLFNYVGHREYNVVFQTNKKKMKKRNGVNFSFVGSEWKSFMMTEGGGPA